MIGSRAVDGRRHHVNPSNLSKLKCREGKTPLPGRASHTAFVADQIIDHDTIQFRLMYRGLIESPHRTRARPCGRTKYSPISHRQLLSPVGKQYQVARLKGVPNHAGSDAHEIQATMRSSAAAKMHRTDLEQIPAIDLSPQTRSLTVGRIQCQA